MSTFVRSTLLTLVAAGTLGTLSLSAQAQPLHHALHHTHGVYASSNGPIETVGAMDSSRRTWIGGARDDDSANAKNPALPWYSRGRGQETGGPARMLIGE